VVKVGAGGTVSIFNSAGTTDVVADVVGWFGDDADAGFVPLVPARVLDTRPGLGPPDAPIGPGAAVVLDVVGAGGVPTGLGVTAVVLNVTVTNPTAPAFLTVWPADVLRPLASNLNFVAGQTVPNLVVVKVSALGQVAFFNSEGSVDVVADVVGYFTA
jgi:hypothetical protein